MTTYRESNGGRVCQRYIETQIRKTKARKLRKQLEDSVYNFCEECGVNGSFNFLDCSHIISVKKCKESGTTEKAWDIENIRILCRDCHQKHDKTNLQWTKK